MCGIYYQRYDYMPYQVHLSVCPFICTYIELPCMYNLGGDEVKAYFIIVQQNFAHNLGLLDIPGFTILLPHIGINP